ncbi:hypothetical protein TraAM80_02533 [Trypanosoma rangeli]|uniref:Uncharacterized protein n=1 Tax=Trypanosoma rangeli TaxID=5698 RepID=A0A422NTG2_TRYRA|nr:uncharacterized protein TraAM80_02533 [Trypanosoma rangeli]RNF08792.1 hypothetical protein TraAM80_02533 [Trypanosoma rangeli]|eukprot:RNF08792.1 hypothetical protein TraAM80_02533 [Trypanosoma rangeli]
MSMETQPLESPPIYVEEKPLTQIPQRFLLPAAPGKKGREASVDGGRPSVHELMRNDDYTKKVARSSTGRLVSHYRVPVSRPLPLHTPEAGADRRPLKRNVESVFASLFRGSGEGAVVPDFLKPAENNRRREIEERKKREEQEQPIFGDPDAKQRLLEPKHMPKLDMKVPVDFVPRCAAMRTQSIPIYAEKEDAQAQAAPERRGG